jgi:hypothetical protein
MRRAAHWDGPIPVMAGVEGTRPPEVRERIPGDAGLEPAEPIGRRIDQGPPRI